MIPPDGTPPQDPLGDMMRSWASMACAALPRPESLAPLAAAAGLGAGASPAGGNLLAQAHMVAAAASLRVWTRSAQSLSAYQQECSAADTAPGDAQDACHADATRAHLRRLGEIAIEEAHALDAQLQGLGEQVRTQVDAAAPLSHPQPRRYARAKP